MGNQTSDRPLTPRPDAVSLPRKREDDMAAKALITWGGWPGHEPDKVAEIFRKMLVGEGVEVTVTDNLTCFDDAEALRGYDLIVPVWTMSELTKQAAVNVSEAVARGTGLPGVTAACATPFAPIPSGSS
jgi:uncharacterized protein